MCRRRFFAPNKRRKDFEIFASSEQTTPDHNDKTSQEGYIDNVNKLVYMSS